MMRRRRSSPFLQAIAVLAFAALLAGCADDEPEEDQAADQSAEGSGDDVNESADESDDATDSDEAAGDAAECPSGAPHTLAMGTFTEPAGLDPTMVSSGRTGAIELAAIFDTLMQRDEETGEYSPRLAASLEANDDVTEWTLTLREGIVFGNGDAFTAEAVKASIERHFEEGANMRNLALEIDSIDVVDDLTLVFNLQEPWGNFPYLLAGPVGMIANPAVLDELGSEEFSENPRGAGAGPFEPVRFAPGEEIVMEAKDDYWDGELCVGELQFMGISAASTAYDSFEVGELDLAFLQEADVIDQARTDGANMVTTTYGAGDILTINIASQGTTPPTADVRVRQAITHALDRDVITERAHGTNRLASSGFLPPDSIYEGMEGPAYDPELARGLVEEVLNEGDWDGSVRVLCNDTPDRQEMAITIEAMLEEVGFDVETSVVSTQDLIQRVIVDANYDVACWATTVNAASPWARLEQFNTDSPRNRGAFEDEETDQALRDLKHAATHEEQEDALQRLTQRWTEAVPAVGIASIEDSVIFSDEVQGLEFSLESILYFNDVRLGGGS